MLTFGISAVEPPPQKQPVVPLGGLVSWLTVSGYHWPQYTLHESLQHLVQADWIVLKGLLLAPCTAHLKK